MSDIISIINEIKKKQREINNLISKLEEYLKTGDTQPLFINRNNRNNKIEDIKDIPESKYHSDTDLDSVSSTSSSIGEYKIESEEQIPLISPNLQYLIEENQEIYLENEDDNNKWIPPKHSGLNNSKPIL